VEVTADVDLRGTLHVDRNVPVGFQTIRCRIDVKAADGTDLKLMKKLVAASEHSCVNLQTLRSSVAIETSYNDTPRID
jgi:hypothetical protein